MNLIPAIDLKGGHVVRAFKGQRDSYAPIASPLAKSSAPQDVVAGFLHLHPFRSVYIADLDAIEGRDGHRDIVLALAEAFPQLRFWLDDGASEPARLRHWLAWPQIDPVVGSESLSSSAFAQSLAAEPRIVLSLDFRGAHFLGPPNLIEAPQLWPQRVVAMTLARVGALAGPDIDMLTTIKRRAGARQVYAAGGLRGVQDIEALAQAGISGALVASALHEGRLTASDLRRYASN